MYCSEMSQEKLLDGNYSEEQAEHASDLFHIDFSHTGHPLAILCSILMIAMMKIAKSMLETIFKCSKEFIEYLIRSCYSRLGSSQDTYFHLSSKTSGPERLGSAMYIWSIGQFGSVAFGGILFGIVGGLCTALAMRLLTVLPLMMILLPYFFYLLTDSFHLSGILACSIVIFARNKSNLS
uniref:Na_H_Exchanger domain-containing protein n=1 Tax=Heterorhabditis bacteriophora TaxID=37862 RepID=A0A1I7WLS1_HETBA